MVGPPKVINKRSADDKLLEPFEVNFFVFSRLEASNDYILRRYSCNQKLKNIDYDC